MRGEALYSGAFNKLLVTHNENVGLAARLYGAELYSPFLGSLERTGLEPMRRARYPLYPGELQGHRTGQLFHDLVRRRPDLYSRQSRKAWTRPEQAGVNLKKAMNDFVDTMMDQAGTNPANPPLLGLSSFPGG